MSVTGNLSLKVQQICVDGSFVKATRILNRDLKLGPTELAMIAQENTRLNDRPKPKPLEHELCSRCGEYVHVSGFSPNKRKKNGLQSNCKACHAEIQAIADNAKLMERLNARMRKKAHQF